MSFEHHSIHEGKLISGQALRSHNGHFRAVMQGDGNFVVYHHSKALWATNTNGKGHGAIHISNQGDFNLVVYDHKGTPLWASDTNGKGTGTPRLTMQDDGNLVLYDSKDHAVWASNTVTKIEASNAWSLHAGSRMHEGHSLVSESKRYKAVMQGDGNFVVYVGSRPLWASNTDGKGRGPRFLDVQTDGNVVVYDADGKATWASDTNGKGAGGNTLIMQDDGNLVLYDSEKKAIWATATNGKADRIVGKNSALNNEDVLVSQNGRYLAVMQNDGNFVVYKEGKALWASNTDGKGAGPHKCIIQGDDNLVVYDGAGKAHWATATNGKGTHGDLILVMQDDGNLVYYSGTHVLWATGTNGK